MQAFNNALDRLMLLCSQQQDSIDDFCRTLTEIASDCLNVERVGLWRLNDSHDAITCIDLFQRSKNQHTGGDILHARDFPNYFEACLESRSIDAADACEDERTSEFAEPYLKPNNIVSLLDAQIRSTAGPRGIVCIESVGARRDWTPAEIAFAASIAELVGFAMDRADREAVHRKLQEVNRNLQDSEHRLSELAEQLPGAIFQYVRYPDERRIITYMSAGCEDLWELPADRLMADPQLLWDTIHPEDLSGVQAAIFGAAAVKKILVASVAHDHAVRRQKVAPGKRPPVSTSRRRGPVEQPGSRRHRTGAARRGALQDA